MKLLKSLKQRISNFSTRNTPEFPLKLTMERKNTFIDGFLNGILSTRGRVQFLQCGANDGITVDPLRHFILDNASKVAGVMIEPLHDVYERLKYNVADFPNIVPLNVATGPDEEITLYRIKEEYVAEYRGIIATGITSFDRSRVLRKAQVQLRIEGVEPEDCIEEVRQNCYTVSQLINMHADLLGNESFLQIDVEGFDDQVIYTIDFDMHRPVGINFEAINLSAKKLDELKLFLEAQGYKCIAWNKDDILAVKR